MRIFYFSGTGNARNVAKWMNDFANSNGVSSEVTDIAKMDVRKVQPLPDEMIGIISPTHGFNFPPIVLNFIFRFPRSHYRNKIFLVNTRAGMKLSKLFLPGLSGIAIILSSLVLLLKGYRIVGMRPIDLPSNWISLHPGLREKVVVSMHQHYKIVAEHFIDKMIHGKKNYRSLMDLPWDIAISPIAFGYYFIGRFILAKTFYASHDCDLCMICIKNCPIKAIRLVDNRPFWSYRCESCMRCMNNCPKRAIETSHGLLAGIMILIYTVIIASLYVFFENLSGYDLMKSTFINKSVRFTFESLLTLLIIIFAYRIVHYLRRFRFFEWIILYTSLTRIKFWRRYKIPKIPD